MDFALSAEERAFVAAVDGRRPGLPAGSARVRFGTLPAMPRRLRSLAVLLGALALAACRTTPDEIRRIEAENELLREQVQTMRTECEQYRKIDIGVDKSGKAPAAPAPEVPPAPP